MESSGSITRQQATIQVDPAVLKKRLSQWEDTLADTGSIFHRMLQTDRGEFFNAWAEDLELAIHARILQIQVEDISTYIYRKLVDAGLRRLTVRARHVLPAKYKRHDQNPDSGQMTAVNISLNRVVCSKCNHIFLPTPAERKDLRAQCPKCHVMLELQLDDPALENVDYIALVREWIGALKILQDKLETEHFSMYLDPDDYYESIQTGFNLLQLLLEALDKRQKVPQATQHILIRFALKYGIDSAAGYYFSYVRQDLFDLTRKETRNIVTKMIESCYRKNGEYDFKAIKDNKGKLHLALEPRNIDLAALDGFYPSKCPSCGACRSTSKYRAVGVVELKCEGCKEFYKPQHIRAYSNQNTKQVDPVTQDDHEDWLKKNQIKIDRAESTHGPKQ